MQYDPDPNSPPRVLHQPPQPRAQTTPMRVWVSSRCMSCAKAMRLVAALPEAARAVTQVVDVDALHPEQLRQVPVTAVPTIQTPDGRSYVGTEAFKFLDGLTAGAAEIAPFSFAAGGSRALAFSEIESPDGAYAGRAQYAGAQYDDVGYYYGGRK